MSSPLTDVDRSGCLNSTSIAPVVKAVECPPPSPPTDMVCSTFTCQVKLVVRNAPSTWEIERARVHTLSLLTPGSTCQKPSVPAQPRGPAQPKTHAERRKHANQYNRSLHEKRKELGLCVNCRSVAIPGTVHCPACKEKRRQMRLRAKERKQQDDLRERHADTEKQGNP